MEFYTVILVIHTILVIFLIGMVLIQRTDSDGLSGLSGGGGNQFLTGRGSANLLTRTTAILAGIFMLTSMTMAVMVSRMNNDSIVDSIDTTVPAAISKDIAPVETEIPKTKAAVPKAKEAPANPEPVVPKPE